MGEGEGGGQEVAVEARNEGSCWIVDGPKVLLIFIAIWAAGCFGLPALGVGGYLVVAFQAVLAAILLIVERYKDVM